MADKPRQARRLSITTVVVLVLTTAVSTAVIAAHNFTDVPDTNTFHEDIEWLADNQVTIGCNPPENTEFCPEENVTREQMSAFMRRLAGTFAAAGEQVVDSSDPVTVDTTTYTELATLEVDTRSEHEADVTLEAHASIVVEAGADAQFELVIARESCEGTVVGSTAWSSPDLSAAQTAAVAVTGSDEVTGTTIYALCAAKGEESAQDGTVQQRGLTGTLVPAY